MLRRQNGRVPVYAGSRIREFADPARVRQLLAAPNARPVVRRRDRAIVGILLIEQGDDSRVRSRRGNPQALAHCAETDENPRGCWTLKKLVDISPAEAD